MCVCRGRRAKNAELKSLGHSYYFAGALKENTLVLFSPLPAGK